MSVSGTIFQVIAASMGKLQCAAKYLGGSFSRDDVQARLPDRSLILEGSHSVMLDFKGAHGGVCACSHYSIFVQICYACYTSRVYILEGYIASRLDSVPDVYISVPVNRISVSPISQNTHDR